MQEAIKILQLALESQSNLVSFRIATENGIITERELLPDTNAERKAEIKAAIEVLRRKVKKDPRVDGLPEFEPDAYWNGRRSKELLVWQKESKFPFLAYYCSGGFWICTSDDEYEEIPTDDILFYCDPDDIV